MKHIGSGWQFDAYARGGLVLKVTTSPTRMAARVLKSYPALALQPAVLKRKIQLLIGQRTASLAQLARRDVDQTLIANFREEKGMFLQDLVTPLDEALKQGRDPYWLIDRYVQSIRLGWKSGFAETSFNFTVNHGLTKRGRVVVLDVGDLCFELSKVQVILEKRLWEQSFSTVSLEPEARRYLLDRMNRLMTADRLEREWREADIVAIKTLAEGRVPIRQSGSRARSVKMVEVTS